ncbi:HD-GYP domain-containing protein [Falsibacillus albus]|uniref:HD-GYP domain-containing protein n=1 Tax=Falsibacillus albus TaxID=2478915 RepID=A0A3L7JQH7_9BACI|nr:HD-GYP domain-containing protein [Falsibacillus albus]RLQ92319.1 HD-GYP domain-containing protein [Falsibacillus albus]
MGFTIGKSGDYIEEVSYDTNNIRLLGRGDGSEVIIQNIVKDTMFYVYPGDNPTVMEFFYILQGEMVCEWEGEKITLGPNDYYQAMNLEEPVHFTTLTDVVYLWFTTEPAFHHLSESMQNFKHIVEEVEKKDRYTYKHSERVARYSVQIAKKLKFQKDRLETLFFSSILHDIGKINTPSEILNKPGRLTKEEFDIVKLHPMDGADMVRDFYYKNIAKIIEQHHERLNGSGYPLGLKGDEILLEARIIAVSDTFDAMTEERSYRKAFDAEYAVEELKKLSGTHYDERVVEIFVEILKEDGIIT